jgi:tRNA (guanine37-N1)-methyltransferase
MNEYPPPEAASIRTIRIITLFPDLFRCWLSQGVVSRAVERGIVDVELVNLREFGVGRHRITDDYPFGGGAGMVMKPEPIFNAVESLGLAGTVPVILLSPRGRVFSQQAAEELAKEAEIVLLAGHYEGVDERVREHLISDEISVGDFVLSAGELPAMVVADAIVRLRPGALAEDSIAEESFRGGLLEYPQYTRPATFRSWTVPDVLLSGHHAEIAAWRRRQALLATVDRRPELLAEADLSAEEEAVVESRLPCPRIASGKRQEAREEAPGQ